MEIGEWTANGEWTATPTLNAIYREIRSLGLEVNLAEIEAFGFTVIRDAIPKQMAIRARDAILHTAEQRLGRRLDLENESDLTQTVGREIAGQHYLLYKDQVFEELVLNERPLAIITYLLGRSCCLSSVYSHVKALGRTGLLLHSDYSNGIPYSSFPSYALTANVNYALTDYSKECGALAVVPGSHRLARQPNQNERHLAGSNGNPHAVPIEVPAGAAIVWHGGTWHGSFPRLVPGLRVNLAINFCRQFVSPQEIYYNNVPEELMSRHGPGSRMAQLLGLGQLYGWQEEGPTVSRPAKLVAPDYSPYA